MQAQTYGYEKRITGASLDVVRAKVTAALAAEGFGVLTEIDVKATLKKKLELDFRPYVILGACNPTLAHRALEADPQVGLLLPCNVVLQQAEGGILVSIVNPQMMFSVVAKPELEPIAKEADERLRRVLAALG
ncbi:MAG: DUF302 domain-containing protein [Proteobacteria bacterium]|nr:DUF302 domain-containing protein [Pseudomonadota bacterium]